MTSNQTAPGPDSPHPAPQQPSPAAASLAAETLTAEPAPAFPRLPGETPRAFGAFAAFFQLGQTRTLAAVTALLGENPDTVRNWSSKYRWRDRIHAFHAGLLQQQAGGLITVHRQHAADWAQRSMESREQEWASAQKLRTAAQCFLENLGELEIAKMTLAQAARALHIASCLARQALAEPPPPEAAGLAPIQLELAAAVQKAYGPPDLPAAPPLAGPPPSAAVPPAPALCPPPETIHPQP